MNLYSLARNIYGLNNKEQLAKSISVVRQNLKGLTEESMCKIYSSYLSFELSSNHVPSRLISTTDLDLNYEHFFILVPSNEEEYFLADLTFSQFPYRKSAFTGLLTKGFQLIDDQSINKYLNIVTGEKLHKRFSVDDIFYLSKVSSKSPKEKTLYR